MNNDVAGLAIISAFWLAGVSAFLLLNEGALLWWVADTLAPAVGLAPPLEGVSP